jgi:hypothetical protein
MRKVTWNVVKGSVSSEDGRSGRNRRNSPAGRRWNRRFYHLCRELRFDSLQGKDEDDEALLRVASARRGVASSSGAMVRTMVSVRFSLLRLLPTEKRYSGEGWRRDDVEGRESPRVWTRR